MALIRPVPTDHGHDVEYWRIEEIKDDLAQRRLEFLLRGYANETARRSGCKHFYEYPLVLADENYEAAPGLEFLYGCVKLLPAFVEAKDC